MSPNARNTVSAHKGAGRVGLTLGVVIPNEELSERFRDLSARIDFALDALDEGRALRAPERFDRSDELAA